MTDYTTIAEVQTAMNRLAMAIEDKGGSQTSAFLKVISYDEFDLWLKTENLGLPYGFETFSADTIAECIVMADKFITDLPSPEDTVTHEYLKRVASAVDYATEHSIADEYVSPLRGVSCAMTDNLLAGPK